MASSVIEVWNKTDDYENKFHCESLIEKLAEK
jgi:hypothetical protein